MARRPVLYCVPPWGASSIDLTPGQGKHVRKVLRMGDGEAVEYTDGRGLVGTGQLAGDQIVRGEERTVAAPATRVVLAVAPPHRKERLRWLVEKASELGVDELLWLESHYGQGSAPPAHRLAAWIGSALEQSRGAWIMRADRTVTLHDVAAGVDGATSGVVLIAVPGAPALTDVLSAVSSDVAAGVEPAASVTLCVGPEGGWHPAEIADDVVAVGLGDRVLRVETAAIVGAALILDTTRTSAVDRR